MEGSSRIRSRCALPRCGQPRGLSVVACIAQEQAVALFFEEYSEFKWASHTVTIEGPVHTYAKTLDAFEGEGVRGTA